MRSTRRARTSSPAARSRRCSATPCGMARRERSLRPAAPPGGSRARARGSRAHARDARAAERRVPADRARPAGRLGSRRGRRSSSTTTGARSISRATCSTSQPSARRRSSSGRLALYDPLTGLANRAFFHEQFQHTIGDPEGAGPADGAPVHRSERLQERQRPLGPRRRRRVLATLGDRIQGDAARRRHRSPARRRRVRDRDPSIAEPAEAVRVAERLLEVDSPRRSSSNGGSCRSPRASASPSAARWQ